MSEVILKCQDVYKKIGKKYILKKISFEVKKGESVGFIGPNGAGKTTTIKLILGLQKITKGKVEINGYDIKKDFEKAIYRVGAIIENPDVYTYLTGYENLKIAQEYYKNIPNQRIDEVVKIVGLKDSIMNKVSKYSLGMRQRLGIAQAILHEPQLLILDEPTNGLDPEGIIEIRNLLKKLVFEENIGILISSHNLSEVENICDKVCIIKSGEIIDEKDIKELKSQNLEECYIIENEDSYKVRKLISTKSEIIDKQHIKIFTSKEQIPKIVKKLEKNDVLIYTITKKDISLEEAFLKEIGGEKVEKNIKE